jgi:hypothetical protein
MNTTTDSKLTLHWKWVYYIFIPIYEEVKKRIGKNKYIHIVIDLT